jgi:phosphoribosylformylglycinamidine synthase subunit PurL
VESSLRNGFGATVELPEGADPFVWLFSESAGRVLVSVKSGADDDLASLCAENDVPLVKLGTVGPADDATIELAGQFSLPLEQIREAWQATIPTALGLRESTPA